MELIYSDPYYDTDAWEEGKYCSELAEALSEFDKEVSTIETDVGHGADFPSVLVEVFKNIDWSSLLTVIGPGGLFLLGERINKNMDAWIEIVHKFKRLIDRFNPSRIDEKGSLLLVLKDLEVLGGNKGEIDVSAQVITFTPVPWGKGTLDKRPDALYIITVKIPSKVYVVGMKSNKRIVFRHEYNIEWLEF
jgi:hypothetical protein